MCVTVSKTQVMEKLTGLSADTKACKYACMQIKTENTPHKDVKSEQQFSHVHVTLPGDIRGRNILLRSTKILHKCNL